jgi:small multidrug resistance pump
MHLNPSFILWLAASMAIFLSAATASRYYVASNNILILLFSLGLYCVGNLMMVRLMRVNLIAFAMFGERLTTAQIAGVALGVVSMALMLLPSSGKA